MAKKILVLAGLMIASVGFVLPTDLSGPGTPNCGVTYVVDRGWDCFFQVHPHDCYCSIVVY